MSDQAVQSLLDIANGFIVTKAYRLFAEFYDACRKYQYIGICYGAPGVGKTLSARHYARWDLSEPIMLHPATQEARPQELANCRSVLSTPPVTYTARGMEREIAELRRRLQYGVTRLRGAGHTLKASNGFILLFLLQKERKAACR